MVILLDRFSRVLHLLQDLQELETIQQPPVLGVGVEVVDEEAVLQLEAHGLHRVVYDGHLTEVPAQRLQVLDITALQRLRLAALPLSWSPGGSGSQSGTACVR